MLVIVLLDLGVDFYRILNQNDYQEIALLIVACKMAAVLSRPQCVKYKRIKTLAEGIVSRWSDIFCFWSNYIYPLYSLITLTLMGRMAY